MAKALKSVEEIHDTIKRRLYTDECVPNLVGLDNQIKYVCIHSKKMSNLFQVDENSIGQYFAANIVPGC